MILIMKKFERTRYNSMCDGSTWFILGLVAACCVVPCFLGDGIWSTIICLVMLAFMLLTFIGIYYRIDGDKHVVYSFFIPTAYPIGKIKEIKPTKIFSHHQRHHWLTTKQSLLPTEKFSKALFLSLYRPCVKRILSDIFSPSIPKLSIWHR